MSSNIATNIFKDSYIEYATLHVPAEAIDAYKNAEPWSGFGTIVALTEEEVKIKSIVADSQNSSFFTLDGKKTDALQKGINIIRTGNQTKKVFVK